MIFSLGSGVCCGQFGGRRDPPATWLPAEDKGAGVALFMGDVLVLLSQITVTICN